MTENYADEPEVVPDNKKSPKFKILVSIAILCMVSYGIFDMTAGKVDAKKQATEASRNHTAEQGATMESQSDNHANNMIGNDGAITNVGEAKKKEMRRKMDEDARAAKLAGQDKSGAKGARGSGFPNSIDPVTGQPREDLGGDEDALNRSKAKVDIPGKPDGWDPEGEIFVPQGQAGTPAYRYKPAYLRGSNVPYDPQMMIAWDQAWISAAQKPSFGKSVAISNTYSKIAGEAQINRKGQGNVSCVRLNPAGQPDPCINQPTMPTPVRRIRVKPTLVQITQGGGQ